MNPSITLVDGVQRHRESPDFKLPTQIELLNVQAGTFVKLMFQQNGLTERMWVEVTEKEVGGPGLGTLSNMPVLINWIRHGELIRFEDRHIIAVFHGEAEDGDESDNVVEICPSCNDPAMR